MKVYLTIVLSIGGFVLMVALLLGSCEKETLIVEEEWPVSEGVVSECPTLRDIFTSTYQEHTEAPNNAGYSWWIFDYPSIGHLPKCDQKFHEWNVNLTPSDTIYMDVMNPNATNRIGNTYYKVSTFTPGDTCFNVFFTQFHDPWNGINDTEAYCTDNGPGNNWEQFANTDPGYITNFADTTYWLYKKL